MAIEGYDLVMLGILAAAAVLGYFKGIVWQLAWIAGIAASTFVALRFSAVVAPFLGQQAPWNRLLAMLILYVGTSLVVWLVFRVVSGFIQAVELSAFDHQLGLLLGLAKGALLCVVITFFVVTLAPAYRGQIVASRSGRIVAELIVRADEYLPPEVVATVQPFVKEFEDQLRGGRVEARPPGQPSALEAIWEGVTSAAAWTGAEQGGAVGHAGGPQADFGWPQPAVGTAAPAPADPAPPSRFTAPPTPAPSSPARPAAPPPAPPQPFPVGAQSPLPIR